MLSFDNFFQADSKQGTKLSICEICESREIKKSQILMLSFDNFFKQIVKKGTKLSIFEIRDYVFLYSTQKCSF